MDAIDVMVYTDALVARIHTEEADCLALAQHPDAPMAFREDYQRRAWLCSLAAATLEQFMEGLDEKLRAEVAW